MNNHRIMGLSAAELMGELRTYAVEGAPASGPYVRRQSSLNLLEFLTDGEYRLTEAREKIAALFTPAGSAAPPRA